MTSARFLRQGSSDFRSVAEGWIPREENGNRKSMIRSLNAIVLAPLTILVKTLLLPASLPIPRTRSLLATFHPIPKDMYSPQFSSTSGQSQVLPGPAVSNVVTAPWGFLYEWDTFTPEEEIESITVDNPGFIVEAIGRVKVTISPA